MQIDKLIIAPKGKWKGINETRRIKHLVKRLPSPLVKKLIETETTIRLTTRPITTFTDMKNLKGISPPTWNGITWDEILGVAQGNKIILRYGCDKELYYGTVSMVLHEIGHAVDYIESKITARCKIFNAIWERERKNLINASNIVNEQKDEFYAETFAMFYLNSYTRNKLRLQAPLTYSYFKDYIYN